ncbi:MAG TPA: transglutaminase domain-containing protein [Pyrinomonadaceae bacterium]
MQPSHRSLRLRRCDLIFLTICLLLLILQLSILKVLPYTTASINDLPVADLRVQRQSPLNGFGIGSIRWDVPALARDPYLEPFRHYFHTYCPDKRGLAAALCLSDSFAQQFPFGDTSNDLFSVDYDPVADLRAHTERGEPGDCVTRSGLAATALLSVGIPACVVSLVPVEGTGHNVLSVWDEQYGWATVDPTTGSVFWNETKPISALDAIERPAMFKAYQLAKEPDGAHMLQLNYAVGGSGLLYGHLLFPEPWLYLRTGSRIAHWPFRAAFIHVGPWQWWMGPAQSALRIGSLLCIALLLVTLVIIYSRAVRRQIEQAPASIN